MLLIEISLNSHQAPLALFVVCFLGTLIQLMIRVDTHFYDLCAPSTVSQHCALQHVMQVHLICVEEIWRLYSAELASAVVVVFFILGRCAFQKVGQVVVWYLAACCTTGCR